MTHDPGFLAQRTPPDHDTAPGLTCRLCRGKSRRVNSCHTVNIVLKLNNTCLYTFQLWYITCFLLSEDSDTHTMCLSGFLSFNHFFSPVSLPCYSSHCFSFPPSLPSFPAITPTPFLDSPTLPSPFSLLPRSVFTHWKSNLPANGSASPAPHLGKATAGQQHGHGLLRILQPSLW